MTESTRSEIITEIKKGRRRRLKALIIKEFYQILRDPSTFLIAILLPMLLMFLYGYGVSLDLDHLRIGAALEDTAPDVQSFLKSMTDSRYFEVTIKRDPRELTYDLEKGAIRGYVFVPSYFSEFRKIPDKIAPIQVVTDGSEPNTANFVRNYMLSTLQNWLIQEAISSNLKGLPLIDVQPRFWFNEQLESRYFLLSGSLSIIMTLIGTLLTALVVAKEWERGTMESLMSTPAGIEELLLGKIIPYFFLGMISMMICAFVAVFFYGIPLVGSFWLLTLVSAIFLIGALGSGLLISIVSKNQIIASQIALTAAFLPSYILSGFLFEICSMPKIIQYLTYIIPAKYFVTCLTTLFLAGNIWRLIIINLLPIVIIGVVFFVLSAYKTVKRLD